MPHETQRPGRCVDLLPGIYELNVLAELRRRALGGGVQVICGRGPCARDQKQLRRFYSYKKGTLSAHVLEPIVRTLPQDMTILLPLTRAVCSRLGDDFLCYVTPTEHLSLPSAADVRIGVIAARIALPMRLIL